MNTGSMSKKGNEEERGQPKKKREVERGPNSTYNVRGSVGLLMEIDHDAPIEPEPQPDSSDYYNVRFFKLDVKNLDATVQKMKTDDSIFTEFGVGTKYSIDRMWFITIHTMCNQIRK